MSAEGVDVDSAEGGPPDAIRQVNEAVARKDLEAVSRMMDPDVVWEHNIGVGSPEEGVYSGRDSVIRLLERITEGWEYLRPVPGEIRDAGGGAYVVRGNLHAKHLASENEIVAPYEQRLELRHGLLVKGRMNTSPGFAARG